MNGSGLPKGTGARALLGLVGMVAGIVSGWQAYARTGSWALAIFAGLLVANYIARGVADIITDPQKGRRLVFFTLPLLFAAAGVAGGYLLWNKWWLGVVVGIVTYIIGSVVATMIFPRIAVEEAADSAARLGSVSQQPAPPVAEPDRSAPQAPSPYNNLRNP